MLVMGFSGLDRSCAYKSTILGRQVGRELRMVQGLDSAVALVDDSGVLAAAAQERYDGDKGTGRFPRAATEACFAMIGAAPEDVDAVAHGFCYEASTFWQLDSFLAGWYKYVYSQRVQREVLREHFPALTARRSLIHVPHHLAHAASTYYLSGFDDALVLVADGMGEHESISFFAGRGGELTRLRTYPILSSLGILYGIVTHYLGFQMCLDEYKVMGLAPYGDRDRYRPAFDDYVILRPGGDLDIPLLSENKSPMERETHEGVVRRLEKTVGPAREPGAELQQHHMDVAATLQSLLERALVHLLQEQRRATGMRRLCMAGGVALNCSANGVILRSGMFDEIFIQPAAGDDGTSLGAALSVLRSARPAAPVRMSMPFWGDEFSGAQIEDALPRLGPDCVSRRLGRRELIRQTVDLIQGGAVVALFQGRMEFGPRALGNRSILADPTSPTMRAYLNAAVKHREEFRPFAPAVTAEDAATFFDIPPGAESAFHHMLMVATVRGQYRARLPAVTHVDGTARTQVVERGSAPLLWELLRETGDRTGIPVLVNTSFNLRGQPIVRSPQDAVDTFNRSALDAMVIGEFLVQRAGPTDARRTESM